MPVAFIRLLKNKEQRRPYLVLSAPIAGLVMTGILSGFINDNPLKITFLGTFSYIKFFLLIFIYAAFFGEKGDLKRLYHIFLVIAVILIFFAFLQETWALYSRYILDLGVNNLDAYLSSYLLKKAGVTGFKEIGNWRWYVYRTPSLMSHYNLFGLFCLFVLSMGLFSKSRKKLFLIFLVIGVLLSVSRISYMGLLFVLVVRIINSRKWYIVTTILFIILALLLLPNNKSRIPSKEIQKSGSYLLREKRISFREYAGFVSLQVWKDHPLFGVGPGMFGGDVAYKYRSPLYEEYNFFEIYSHVRSLDQLWPQLLAETGIIGLVVFIELLLTIYILMLLEEENGAVLTRALGAYTVVLFFYFFSNNLNNPALFYPYCAFIGVCLGSDIDHET